MTHLIWWHGRSITVLAISKRKESATITLPKSWADRAPKLPDQEGRLVEVVFNEDGTLLLRHLKPATAISAPPAPKVPAPGATGREGGKR